MSRTLAAIVLLCGACGGPSSTAGPEPAAGGTSSGEVAVPSGDEGESPEGDPAPPAMQGLLAAHDRVRAQHCAPPLTWSAELAATAQEWADGLVARGCVLEHSRSTLGENLAMATTGALDAESAVQQWYREHERYRYRPGGFSMETGHFTQVVWVGTRTLGCGTATCQGMEIWVCNYDPPGNVEGEYRTHVLPTSCR